MLFLKHALLTNQDYSGGGALAHRFPSAPSVAELGVQVSRWKVLRVGVRVQRWGKETYLSAGPFSSCNLSLLFGHHVPKKPISSVIRSRAKMSPG